MEEKRKLEVKERLLEIINLSKKDPIAEENEWDKYEKTLKQYESIRRDHTRLMKNFYIFSDNGKNIKLFTDELNLLLKLNNSLFSICSHRRNSIIDLFTRENYQMEAKNVFFHLQNCNFYTLSPFFKEDVNANKITLVKTISMQPVEFEFQKKDDGYRFYERTLRNKLEEAPIYSLAELGIEEETTTTKLYLMEKYYGDKLKRK